MFEHEIVDVTEDKLPFKVILHKSNTAFIRRHWHRSFEISYTMKGETKEFIVNGHHYNPQAGTIILVNPNEIHSVLGVTKPHEENLVLSILLPYDFMEEWVPNFAYRYYQIPDDRQMTEQQLTDYRQLQFLFTEMFQSADKEEPLENLYIIGLMYEALYLLTGSFSTIQTTKNNLSTTAKEFDWIDKVLVYIRQELASSLSVSELADKFHLNESYFSRKFKKYMDMPVMDYVGELRLQEAYQLLTNTDISVQAIADQCGFPNHKSLTTRFKKRYGLTPRNYRKKITESHKMTKK